MDPISALSLSAAILQFMDFSSKIIVTTYKTHRSIDGTTQENVDLAELTTNLHGHQARLAAPQAPYGGQDVDQKALEELAAKCRDIAADLLKLLDDLKVKVKQKGLLHTWESLRQGCRTVWKKEKITRYERLLREIAVQVNGRLLSMTRDETSTISQQLTGLIQSSERLRLGLEAGLQDARTGFVAEVQAQSAVIMNLNVISNYDQTCGASYYSLLGSLPLRIQQLLREARKITTSQRVLQSLLFEEITQREEQIHHAYAKTYTWIFEDDTTSFKRWLTSDGGIFWVSGKAGSGKSTLMKFLVNHEDTKILLRQWSGSAHLVVASFFFWGAGKEAQKSQLGLMRSLLYQILRQCPDLIPPLWPSRWDAGNYVDNRFDRWTRQQLSDAVDEIVARGSLKPKFCFFVDGLDEYADAQAGDHYTLVQYLDRLARSPHVKVCVSSRPWNVFRARFDKHDDLKLVLQDLTSEDMLEYAQGLLQEDDRFRRLVAHDPKALFLATQIRNKAEGVFLWVHLVTLSLKRGLGEHDDTKGLERRLAQTPSDLIEFFRSIFRNIDDNYKDYTMRALQIAAIALPMPWGAFKYIPQEVEDHEYAIRQQVQFDPNEKDLWGLLRSTTLDATIRVNKWCRDLLEVQHGGKNRQRQLFRVIESEVQFLHRTVRDFLLTQEMQDQFLKHSVCTSSPWKAVCRMHLAYTKACCGIPEDTSRTSPSLIMTNTQNVLRWAKLCEVYDQATPYDILNELAMTRLAAQNAAKGLHGLQASMLRLAVQENLLLYVDHTPDRNVRAEPGILWNALLPRLEIGSIVTSRYHDPHIDDLAMIAKLLEKGCNPNDGWSADGTKTVTVWQKLISTTYPGLDSDDGFASEPDLEEPNWTLESAFGESVFEEPVFKEPVFSKVAEVGSTHKPLATRADIVSFLLIHGADPDAKSEVRGRTRFGFTIHSRDFLMQLFNGNGRKVDALLKEARNVRLATVARKPWLFANYFN